MLFCGVARPIDLRAIIRCDARGIFHAKKNAAQWHKNPLGKIRSFTRKFRDFALVAFQRRAYHRPRMATKSKKSTRKPNAAFMKPVQPDAVLSVVVGSKPLPRTELTKKLWVYIKKNNLQDKKVRTQINADDALKAVFGGKTKVSMFEMTKLVSKHVKA